MQKTNNWKLSVLASAILATAGLPLSSASALTLGQVRVQSALGEPLKATIPITSMTSNEESSLRAGPASPDVFNQQGAIYSPVISQMQVQLQKLSNGESVLLLTTSTPVNEPFLDLVFNAVWNGGQLVRSYALLLDPPHSQKRATPSTAAAPAPNNPAFGQSSANQPAAVAKANKAPAQTAAAAPQTQAPVLDNSPANVTNVAAYERALQWQQAQGIGSGPAPKPAQSSKGTSQRRAGTSTPAQAPAAAPTQSASGTTINVQKGDTAGAVARRNMPANVSLDQMLIALQRANPNAFINGNVNLLRSGARLQVPSTEEIQAISAQEARRLVTAQTQDFKRYQGQLARNVPSVQAQGSDQTAAGQVAPVVTTPQQTDSPELVVGSTPTDTAVKTQENRIAEQRQAKEDADRKAERLANIKRMEEIQQALASKKAEPESAPAPEPVPAPSTEEAPSPAPEQTAPTTPAAESTSETTTPTEARVEPEHTGADGESSSVVPSITTPEIAPAPAPAPEPAPAPVPAPAPAPENSLLDDYPMLPWAAGALAFLLAGYGFARYRKRKNEAAGDDVVYENDGQVPSDFFESKDKNGKSGKDGVEATNSSVTNMATGLSSMAYSPSQIDATGEGDPVLEADVLLAYGRDQQAEEVLKEAEQHDPNRISIKVRLAEIYAARQDRISLAAVATSMEALTQRTGTEWEKIAELGRNLDATNVLYQNNAAEAASPVVASHTDEPGFEVEGASGFGPLSGLDFDAPSSKADETASASSTQQLVTDTSAVGEDLDLSLDLGEITPSKIDDLDSHLDFDVSNFNLENPDSVPAATEPAQLGGKPHADADFPSIETADFEATDGLGLELQQTDLAPVPASQEDLTKSLELDLSALSLDDSELSSTVQSHITTVSNTTLVNDALDDAAAASDPLFTKLALAKEFHSLGDAEGARALIQEVIDQAQGDLLEKAKALQEQLS